MCAFKSAAKFKDIKAGIESKSDGDRESLVKKTNAVFQFDVKSGSDVKSWTIDLKNGKGSVTEGAATKADATISVSDDDFIDLVEGKINGQKAFMSGKIKVKGQMMLATKLDAVLKTSGKSKL